MSGFFPFTAMSSGLLCVVVYTRRPSVYVQTFSRACPLANLCVLHEAIPLEMSFRACLMLTQESSSTNWMSSFSPPFPPSAHPSHLPLE